MSYRLDFPLWALLIAVSLGACAKSSEDETATQQKNNDGKLAVYVVNYPLKYFAERIAGDHAAVVFPGPHDSDPAFWMPDSDAIAAYQQADLILLNGAGYAKWVGMAALPGSKLVDTSAPFEDALIVTAGTATHSHGPGGEHAHAGTAFTTWIDPLQAAKQAEAIKEALGRVRPQWDSVFQSNYEALERDLLALDRDFQSIVERGRTQPLVASHPVYQYFSRRYGLDIESVLWEPDEPPAERQWREFEDRLDTHPAKWMIWEGGPDPAVVNRLKSMGVGSVVFDPCGNVPEVGDYLSTMRENAARLRVVF